ESHPLHHDSSDPLHLLLSSLNISSTSESIPIIPQSPSAAELWNIDVMHIVMSYADRTVVSNLMKTCNTLNSAGTRYLLENGVSLRREEGLVSFVWFLWARGDSNECFRRVTLLNKLTLDFHDPKESTARILESLFGILARGASNLTFLKIWAAEALLALHPPLGAAIATLTQLKILDFFRAGEHCAKLLRTLQSSLVTVKIYFATYSTEREDEVLAEPDVNPILLLEGSQSTLESLSASFALSSPDGPCYTNVTHLELSCAGFPYIEDYIRAFPNLQSLTSFEYAGFGDELEWHERREIAMVHQVQHGTWQSMRHYQGSLLMLWIWGLTCRIPSVRLSFDQRRGLDPNFLNDIILDVRPSDLSLRLPGASWLLDDAVRSVLSEEGRLQVLDICILFHINESDDTVSVGHILDLLVDVVRASSVESFKLVLDLAWMGIVRRRKSSVGLPVMPFEEYLRDMDVDAYANTLFASAASLKEVQVSVVELRGLNECRRQADRKRRESLA
ncbi:hypothetical protein V8D89_007699, partial [Ganoderma adspersum]